MSELRKDPIVGRWVIISPERGKRPSDYATPKDERETGFCPLCPGNESMTPQEIFAFREKGTSPDGPGWSIRVVPNKFPALKREGKLEPRNEGLFDWMNGVGEHEVVIETPGHGTELPDLPLDHIKKILFVFKLRMEELSKDPRFRYVVVFKNRGREAGASLHHSHSQIIALPIVPKRVFEELEGGKRYLRDRGSCVYCEMLEQEKSRGLRLVEENEDFIAFAPFAARFPFETWIFPKAHASDYRMIRQPQYRGLAEILSRTLKRIDEVLDDPPYNMVFHTAPLLDKELPYFHWHIEIIPKVTRVAGFEWGTGFYINPTPPEQSAAYLREVTLPE
ncbi:MAG: galactose-1-phosphate uridylyltransferase [Deltaproteobacteria bacterium]|nr:MAG: galactose-1-phosphate uridylyltransferase [Deltaproteobacteria bacterium]